ncbi:MAG: isoprenylcysteine carboxylmethyltransferase family protein [Anaerolineae bacterium]|nr:isoprenylcysteine carboxylmethyltransferase family protein [Anaerolineae bacterium]
MPPIFVNDVLLTTVWGVSCLIWCVIEVSLEIRQFKRFRAGARRQDKGSHTLVGLLIRLGLALCVLLAFTVPSTAITSARDFLFWLGILLVYAGIALRLYAIHALGASFTTIVAITPDQPVIESGPYRLIRHPAYTGFLITLLGFGISFTNWLSLLVLMGCALIGFSYRIRVEERVLQEHLGQRYQEYMRRTKRLIPFVL